MAYTINNTRGTIVATVEDGVLDTTTTLQLIGRNYQSYGEAFNENLVKLLENSASTSAPSAPLTGELWYDTSASVLKVYDGSNFNPVSIRNSATTPTTGLAQGTLWNDTTNDQLYMYDGSAFDLVGPIYKTGDGVSGWRVDVENLSGGGTANVLGLYQDGTRVAIVSKTERLLDSTPTGFDSQTVPVGMSFYTQSDSTTFRLHGTAQNALELGGREAARYLVDDQDQSTSGSFGVLNNNGITLGSGSDASITISSDDLIVTNNNANQNIIFKINQASTVTTAMTITDTADVNIAGNLTIQGNLVTAGSSSSFADSVLAINDQDGSANPRTSNQNAGLLIDGGSVSDDVTFQVKGSDGGYLESSSGLSVATGTAFSVNGTSVLNATTLGSGVVTSSLTTVGALNSGSITTGFGDIDIGTSQFRGGDINVTTVNTETLTMNSDDNTDSSTKFQITNFTNQGDLHDDGNSTSTLVSEYAIKKYVDTQIGDIVTDLVFSMDISGLNNSEIATVLETLAPAAGYNIGTKARIAGVSYSPSASSSYSGGSIGNPASVSTSVTFNTSRNNDLIFHVVAGPAWQYLSG